MSTEWTQDRVTSLAPDPASLKAGQGLALVKKWVSVGQDDVTAWGECQGSGAKPYQVRFDLAEATSKCSCPSRKFPCKHVLGLMLMLAGSPGGIARASMPPWVEEWVNARLESARKKQAKAQAPPKPVDEAAQANRIEQRLARIGQGLAALKTWTEDLVRGGIATVPARGYAFFDEPARRLVDAQAPGAAARVQKLAQIAASGAQWQHRFVEQLSLLYLLIRAFEGIDALPEPVRQDVLATVGVPAKVEEVAALPGVRDTWQVLAQEVDIEDRLRVQRTWLFGQQSRRPALILAFAFGNAPLDPSLSPAMVFEGELSFFPGSPLRAVVKSRGELKPLATISGLAGLDELGEVAGNQFAQSPWLEEVTAPVHALIPQRAENGWNMVDAHGRMFPATLSDPAGWLAMAASGGRPADLVTAYDGRTLRPLALVAGGDYVALTGTVA